MNTEYFDSSLKHFNFKGWTADQILEKYESVLASREKQITDLSNNNIWNVVITARHTVCASIVDGSGEYH